MIGHGTFDQPEMREVEFRRIDLADFGDRFVPRFNMQLGRDKWRDGRSAANADTGDITAENAVVPLINMMVTGVPGSSDGANFKRRNTNNFHVLHDPDPLGRDWRDPPPYSSHVVAKNARGRLDEFHGIDQVRRAARMHINGRAGPSLPRDESDRLADRTGVLGKTPRGARMIQMNVTEKDVSDICWANANFSETGSDVLKS